MRNYEPHRKSRETRASLTSMLSGSRARFLCSDTCMPIDQYWQFNRTFAGAPRRQQARGLQHVERETAFSASIKAGRPGAIMKIGPSSVSSVYGRQCGPFLLAARTRRGVEICEHFGGCALVKRFGLLARDFQVWQGEERRRLLFGRSTLRSSTVKVSSVWEHLLGQATGDWAY